MERVQHLVLIQSILDRLSATSRGVLLHHLLQLILEHLELLEQIRQLLCLERELILEETLELHGLRRWILVDIPRELNLFLESLDVLLSGEHV